ncbi:MAG TPA: hypothetical protein ENN68_01775 [Methanomicrobia archaeon]|nr:hypothetical protein [Methanomicrobia archaeon]
MTAAVRTRTCGSKRLVRNVLLFFVLTLINALLVRYGELFKPGEFGLSGIYLAVGVMIAFGLWFGLWGVLAAFAGYMLGASLPAGVPATVGIALSLADLIQVLIPVLAFQLFAADAALRSRQDLQVFLAFGWFLNNLLGALIGSGAVLLFGVITPEFFLTSFFDWLISNLIVTLIVTIALLRLGTPFVRSAGLFVERYWC